MPKGSYFHAVTCGLVLLVVVCVMFVGSARLPVGYAGADGGSIYVVFTVVLTCVWLCVNVSSRCLRVHGCTVVWLWLVGVCCLRTQ